MTPPDPLSPAREAEIRDRNVLAVARGAAGCECDAEEHPEPCRLDNPDSPSSWCDGCTMAHVLIILEARTQARDALQRAWSATDDLLIMQGADLAILQQALQRYGQHRDVCDAWVVRGFTPSIDETRCACGLAALLSGSGAAQTETPTRVDEGQPPAHSPAGSTASADSLRDGNQTS